MVGVLADIGERKAAKASARETAAFRATLSDALRPLSRPSESQAAASRALGHHLGANRAHYVEIEPDDERSVMPDDYAPSLAGRYQLADFPAIIGSCRADRAFVAPDIAADPRIGDAEKARYAALPVAAIAVVPLPKKGRLVALLSVYFDAPHSWSPGEVALIEETAGRAWGAIEAMRFERALRDSEARYRQIVEGAEDLAIVMFDEGSTVASWNSGAERIVGLAAHEAIGQLAELVYIPED